MYHLTRLGLITTLLCFGCGGDSSPPENDSGTTRDGGGVGMGRWNWCPDQSAYVGDSSWTQEMVVKDTLMCWNAPERAALSDVKSGLQRLHVLPGSHPIPPREAGNGDITIPLCFEKDGVKGASLASTGGSYTTSDTALNLSMPLDDGTSLTLGAFAEFPGLAAGEWPDLVLDDSNVPNTGGTIEDGVVSINNGGFYAPCDLDSGNTQSVETTFGNGDTITFSAKIVAGSVGTGPSGSHKVTGTIDGQSIDISNYYQILYSPAHHHAPGGDFVVFFDEAIRGACGLKILQGTTASLVDCDLNDIQSLTITDSSLL